LIVAKSSPLNVSTVKTFTAELTPVTPTTSVNFVCDRGFTTPGESVYVAGSIPALGEWNSAKAIKLDPNVYYQYIIDGRSNPGPVSPVWTSVLTGLTPNTTFEWKCLKRREDATGTPVWQTGNNNRFTTGQIGYAGRSYGTLP
jgi:hypothetical protein